MDEIKKKTETMLRAVLVSSPRGVPLYRLDKEYRSITYEPIPYKKCGFQTLEAFLRAMPNVARLQTDRDGETVVVGVSSEADQHMAKLIAKQKKPKLRKSAKKPFRRPMSSLTRSYTPMFTTRRFGPRPNVIPSSVKSSIASRISHPPRISSPAPVTRAVSSAVSAARRVTVAPSSKSSDLTKGAMPRFVPPRMMRLAMGTNERTSRTTNTTRNVTVLGPSNKEPSSARTVKFIQSFTPVDSQEPKRDGRTTESSSQHKVRFQLGSKEPKHSRKGTEPSSARTVKFIQSFTPVDSQEPKRNGRTTESSFQHKVSFQLGSKETKHSKKGTENEETSSRKIKMRDGPNFQDMEVTFRSESNAQKAAYPATTSAARSTTNSHIAPLVLERVQKTVASKPKGLFATRLSVEYKSEYNEELPSDVVEALKTLPDVVRTEEPMKGFYIFYPCAKQQEQERPPAPAPAPEQKEELIKEVKVELFYLRSRIPEVGSTVEVYISHVNSLHDFYVQYKSCEDKLTNLQELLMTDCQTSSQVPRPADGMFCIAQFTEDDSWYRAKIMECVENKNTVSVKVLYVDFGNHEYLPSTRLRHLKETHAEQPMMALHCSLDGIDDLTSNEPEMATACLQCFKDLTLDAVIKMTVMERKGEVLLVNLVTLENLDLKRLITKDVVKTRESDSETFSTPAVTETKSLPTSAVHEAHAPVVVEDNSSQESRSRMSSSSSAPAPVLVEDNSSQESHSRMSSSSSTADEASRTSPPPERKKSLPKPFLRSRSLQKDQEVVKIPERVVVPDELYIDLEISNIHNTEHVSAMLYGEDYSDKLLAMEISMKSYFDDNSEAFQAKVGDLCAIYTKQLHADEQWYRVRVLSVKDSQAQLEFVDYGDIKHSPLADLKALPARFFELPFQAFTVSLYGIPKSRNHEVLEKLKHVILGKHFVAEIIDRTGDVISVELYDTSSESDVNINNIVRSLIIPDEDLKPALPKAGQETTVIVVYVSESDSLFVQIPGAGLTRLEELMTDITEHYSKTVRAAEFVPKPHAGHICCCKSSDGSWYRAIITKVLAGERKVEVQYVDYGHTEVIPAASLREPTKANEHVSTLPFQAVEVKLSGIKESLTSEQRDKLMQLASDSECVVLEVMRRDTLPLVNLFLTTEDEIMVNILDYVLERKEEGQAPVKEEEASVNGSTRESDSTTEKYSSSQEDDLEEAAAHLPPPITLSRPWVDLTVSEITDPGNFMFQPLEMLQAFEDMMDQMAQHYETAKKEPLVSPRQGDMCVAKNHDGRYYRALVKAVLAPQQICVRFVDYGDFGILHSSALQVLREEFQQLPCLAVQAALADLHGIDEAGYWSDEAKTRFEQLAQWKQLVGSVAGDQYTYSFREEHKVPLNLYDTTSPDQDVNIGDLLVNEGLAKRVKS